jgi:hypothetical protein
MCSTQEGKMDDSVGDDSEDTSEKDSQEETQGDADVDMSSTQEEINDDGVVVDGMGDGWVLDAERWI